MPPSPDPAPLDPARNPDDLAFLATLQGNILNPHGRNATRLLLFWFDEADPALRRMFRDAAEAKDARGYSLITTAAAQWQASQAYKAARQPGRSPARPLGPDCDRDGLALDAGAQPFYSLALSLAGMTCCGYRPDELPGHADREFDEPMSRRFHQLDDVPPGAQRPDWEAPYLDEPHGVWQLAHDDPAQLDGMQQAVEAFLAAHDATVTFVEDGLRWRDEADPDRLVREPFGFLDCLSQPEFFAGPDYDAASKWVRLPRSQVLIQDGGPHDGGSFLVLRKLEQNVKAFRAWENDAGLQQELAGIPSAPRDAGALLVGRERDGTPLAATRHDAGLNNFDFDQDVSRCPFHAHIRKCNPRINAGQPGIDAAQEQLRREALFVRRSAVYDTPDARGRGQLPRLASAHYPEGDTIEQGVGLLFMGYMSSIQRQFVVLQKNWFANWDFPVEGTQLADPLLRPHARIAGGNQPPRWSWPTQPGVTPRILPQCVRTLGGVYFYVPSLRWLRAQ